MNLRQKAKYYKRKYEQNRINYYDRTLFPAPTIQTEKIMAVKMVREEVLLELGADAEEIITDSLVNAMKDDIKKYMNIESNYIPQACYYQYYGSVRVVKGW